MAARALGIPGSADAPGALDGLDVPDILDAPYVGGGPVTDPAAGLRQVFFRSYVPV